VIPHGPALAPAWRASSVEYGAGMRTVPMRRCRRARALARSPRRRGVEPGGVDLDDGDIVRWVRSDDGSGHGRMTVGKHDTNLDGTLNDVIVGHDHAVRRDDDAAPLSVGFPDLAARRGGDLHDAHVDDRGQDRGDRLRGGRSWRRLLAPHERSSGGRERIGRVRLRTQPTPPTRTRRASPRGRSRTPRAI
jgi:hypothetical protein